MATKKKAGRIGREARLAGRSRLTNSSGHERVLLDCTDHINALCSKHGIQIDWRKYCSEAAWTRSRRIRIQEIRKLEHYYAALHEIGHIIGRQPTTRLEKEYEAWQWALTNAKCAPDEATWLSIHAALRSYITWARERQYRMHVRPVIPPKEHPLWKFMALAKANF